MVPPSLRQGRGFEREWSNDMSMGLYSNIMHRISSAKYKSDGKLTTSIELDSHADSAVVGRSAYILERTGNYVSVSGFTDRLGKALKVEVVHACLAYDCEKTGKIYILVIRNALHVPEMTECLIHPIMMRLVGIEVDECPKFLSTKPSISNHSIYFKQHDLRIPLKLNGIISFIHCRMPSKEEIEFNDGVFELTPNVDKWEPHEMKLEHQEDSMVDYSGQIKADRPRKFIVSGVTVRDMDPNLFCDDIITYLGISSVRFAYGKGYMDAKELARKWNISERLARRTIATTSRLCPRNSSQISLNRRYTYNDRMLRYRHIPINMFSDTMFSTRRVGKSIRNFTCAQVFATDFGWTCVYLMEYEREIPRAFKSLFKDHCVPNKMIVDGARTQVKGETANTCRLAGCTIVELERGTPSANRAERTIGELKTDTKSDMARTKSPIVMWCYCLQRRARINRSMAKDNFQLNGSTPHSYLTGDITDISAISSFDWYQWVKYRREGPEAAYPLPHERIGRCLGPAVNKGNEMSQYVLVENGSVLPIQTLRELTQSEIEDPTEVKIRREFDMKIESMYGNHLSPPPNWAQRRRRPDDDQLEDDPLWAPDNDEKSSDDVIEFSVYEDGSSKEMEMPEVDELEDLDRMLGMELMLPQDGIDMRTGRVIGRVTDRDGRPVGKYDKDPLLDTRIYDVEFADGNIQQYSANVLAEAIHMECDDEGRRSQTLQDIIECRKEPDALAIDESIITLNDGRQQRVKTTRGWKFLVRWKDGQASWIPLKDLKESYPIEVAEFAIGKGLANEPAFKWWVPDIIKKKETIISAIQQRTTRKTHKFGIEVPSSVEHSIQLDKRNNNNCWRDAIRKEMGNVRVAFQILEEEEEIPVGYKELSVHLIFDVKMDLTRKARLVADGHKTPDPIGSTYAGVVSRESVRIALTYAALLGLEVWGADIQNAYLSAPSSERFWIRCGSEFGPQDQGKRAIVRRALYGTKSAGRDFRNHLRDCMDHLGFAPCRADPDLWMRVAIMNGTVEYYEYVLLYVDDCLVISKDPEGMLKRLGKYFVLKDGSVGPPSLYLGAKISQVILPNGVRAYAWSPSKYIQEAIRNLEVHLNVRGYKLRNRVNSPFTPSYRPECDTSEECDEDDARLYLSLIGLLRWMVELGRVDLVCEVSMMSSYTAAPRKGHLLQLFHMFAFLKAHHNSRMVFDPSYPDIDIDQFPKKEWKHHYGSMKEEVTDDCPRPLGKELIIRAYVDADFAGDQLTRRSRTGFIVMVNSSPVYWYSKKQAVCETSSFGSEFLALKTCCEYLHGLRIKLRQMGIPILNPCFIYGDNQSVLWNTTCPDSVLRKKTSSVAYHFVREGVSRDEWRTSYIKTSDNPSDICTKSLPAGANRKRKVRSILYDIYPEEDGEL